MKVDVISFSSHHINIDVTVSWELLNYWRVTGWFVLYGYPESNQKLLTNWEILMKFLWGVGKDWMDFVCNNKFGSCFIINLLKHVGWKCKLQIEIGQ